MRQLRKRNFIVSVNTRLTDKDTIREIEFAFDFAKAELKFEEGIAADTFEVKSGSRVRAAMKALRNKLREANQTVVTYDSKAGELSPQDIQRAYDYINQEPLDSEHE